MYLSEALTLWYTACTASVHTVKASVKNVCFIPLDLSLNPSLTVHYWPMFLGQSSKSWDERNLFFFLCGYGSLFCYIPAKAPAVYFTAPEPIKKNIYLLVWASLTHVSYIANWVLRRLLRRTAMIRRTIEVCTPEGATDLAERKCIDRQYYKSLCSIGALPEVFPL